MFTEKREDMTPEPHHDDGPESFMSGIEASAEVFLPTVQKLLEVLRGAEKLDSSLRNPDFSAQLARRFVVRVADDPEYPFQHKRVVLRPKHGESYAGIEGMTLRYGLSVINEERLRYSPDGVVFIAIGQVGGVVSNFYLTPNSWSELPEEDTVINVTETGIVLGFKDDQIGGTVSRFGVDDLALCLDFFEPELQRAND